MESKLRLRWLGSLGLLLLLPMVQAAREKDNKGDIIFFAMAGGLFDSGRRNRFSDLLDGQVKN